MWIMDLQVAAECAASSWELHHYWFPAHEPFYLGLQPACIVAALMKDIQLRAPNDHTETAQQQ